MHGSNKSDKHIILNHKFINDSLNWVYNESVPTVMNVGSKKKDTSIQYQIYSRSGEFRTFDKRVYNAICSLYEADNVILTPSMVYRHMNGMNDKEKVSPASIQNIKESIDKCTVIKMGIDFTNDMANYRQSGVKQNRLQGQLLNATPIKILTGGKEVDGYRINEKPLLYEYVQQYSNHILSVDTQLLNVKDQVKRESRSTLLIKEFLIRRISTIKRNPGRLSNRITFDSIYREIELEHPSAKQIRMTRENTEKILLSLIDKGLFKKYEPYRQGMSFKGIKVFY